MELNFCFVSQGGVPSGPHMEHDRDFDEVHAQIAGCGMMRIYEYDNKERRHQELIMAPGTVHDKMYDSQGRYPWHEYMSVTPCIYCPIELDRGNENYNMPPRRPYIRPLPVFPLFHLRSWPLPYHRK